ncbi:MAG: glycosyltransferase family 4 protein [Bdellovibrionales bacterium]|nr:glycosyltransferase family 4 protein [Bdellovibrionales bacterium]
MRRHQVLFEKGSQFILLDAFWTYDITRSFRRSNQGVKKVTAVIYDLIPLLYPQFVEKANCYHFAKAFPHLLDLADQFVCISQTVAQDLEKYMRENSSHRKPVFSFRLGSDFGNKNNPTPTPVAPSFKAVFEGGPVWITVSTIEPRKNHDFILDAFDALWAKGENLRLLIVGRIGWMCDDLMTRIKTHPELNQKLFFMHSVSDTELSYCYEHSRGLVFASHVEGFGLPIVEAMRMKLTVLCSDIPVFREVGGSYPTYFSLHNPHSLAQALLNPSRPDASPPSWPNWDESFKEFIDVSN